MTKDNITEILSTLKVAYPNSFANITKADAQATIELWYKMFKDADFVSVKVAISSLINTSKYPPTIAEVKEEMYKISNTDCDVAIDEWNKIKKALGNSLYNSVAEFEALPPIAKRFVGSPNQLREWGMSTDFNDGVVRGQFFKQYEILEKREKYQASMPADVKKYISEIADKKAVGYLEEANNA